jgi:hypothetical protein
MISNIFSRNFQTKLMKYIEPAAILQGFSLFSLGSRSYFNGVSALIEPFFRAYKAALWTFCLPVELAFRDLFDRLGFHISLKEHWRSAFSIVILYFITDLWASYVTRGLPKPATYFAGIGALIIALIACLISGLYPIEGVFSPAVYVPILSFGVFEVLKAFNTATYARNETRTWGQDFYYYFFVYGILNFLIGWMVVYYTYRVLNLEGERAMFAAFVLFLLCVVARNLLFSYAKPLITGLRWKDTGLAGTAWQSGAHRTARKIIRVLGWLLLFFTLNAAAEPFWI